MGKELEVWLEENRSLQRNLTNEFLNQRYIATKFSKKTCNFGARVDTEFRCFAMVNAK